MPLRLFAPLALVLVLSAQPAGAALVEVDLPGGNLNEVTRDTLTGLDWLDVTETTSVSFDDAVATATGLFGAGWRHATGAEVCALYATYALDPLCAGSPLSSPGFPTDLIAPHTENDLLFSTLGLTFSESTGDGQGGFYDDEDGGDPNIGRGVIDRTSFRTSAQVLPNTIPTSAAVGTLGNYLVRASVPEPATAVLLVSGLLGLAGLRRAHRR